MELLRYSLYSNLINILNNSDESQIENNVNIYLDSIKNHNDFNLAKEHSQKINEIKNLDWLNSSKSFDIKNDLKGHLILIDFWTYCCINCMHIIPLLNQLENEFKDLIVIGVHSSKFTNEKSKLNIQTAARRHLIKHPIVCDSNLTVWNKLEVYCWPTLLVIDPYGLIIAEFQGEIQANLIRKFLTICYKYYKNDLLNSKIDFGTHLSLNNHDLNLNRLHFPTKICHSSSSSSDADLLFISDSGNNRIICYDLNKNRIKLTIGCGRQGHFDSNFSDSQFDWPQGLFYDNETNLLYIADTFNDLIRVADLTSNQVSTLCGISNKTKTSIGDYDYIGGKNGLEQSISSPWDLCLFKKDNSKVLIISCAGTHQIWLYSFEDKKSSSYCDLNYLSWFKKLKIEWGKLVCIAGNGDERNKNNSYPLKASFAQPSGLCLDSTNQNLYITDSESSTIRFIDLKDGCVKLVAGGDCLQPDNLFAYGDLDGKGSEAKFQHPLDVKCYDRDYLLVADSYNNSIKRIDLKTKFSEKLILKNDHLNEPNGLCVDVSRNVIWIADTNNHTIKMIRNFDINSKLANLEEFDLKFSDQVDSVLFRKLNLNDKYESEIKVVNSSLKFRFKFKLNENAENSWCMNVEFNSNKLLTYSGLFNRNNLIQDGSKSEQIYKLDFDFFLSEIETIKIDLKIVFCENFKNVCKLVNKKLNLTKQFIFDNLNDNSILVTIE